MRKGQDWFKFRQNSTFIAGGKQNGFLNGWVKVYQNRGQCQVYFKTAEKESDTLNQLKPLTFSWCTLIWKGNMVQWHFTLYFSVTIQRKQKDKSGVPGRVTPCRQNAIPGKSKSVGN